MGGSSRGEILDTGPLVAYLAKDERHHAWATEQFRRLEGEIFTCEAVISEAWFLLRHAPRHLLVLQEMLKAGVFDLSFHLEYEAVGVCALMESYRDVPMSLADACLVRLSEQYPALPLITLDGDFKVYRRNRNQLIEVIAPD